MTGLASWPRRCTLQGCTDPARRPHHHHMYIGHLVVAACTCPKTDQPGARPSAQAIDDARPD